jgi:hypothetical protein
MTRRVSPADPSPRAFGSQALRALGIAGAGAVAAWIVLPLPAAWWVGWLPIPWIIAIGAAANHWGPGAIAGAAAAWGVADRGPHARRWRFSVGLAVAAGVTAVILARPAPPPPLPAAAQILLRHADLSR